MKRVPASLCHIPASSQTAHLGAVEPGCDHRAAIITKPQRALRWLAALFDVLRGKVSVERDQLLTTMPAAPGAAVATGLP